MRSVKIIREYDEDLFQIAVNSFLEEVQDEGGILGDIRFSTTTIKPDRNENRCSNVEYCALVDYDI